MCSTAVSSLHQRTCCWRYLLALAAGASCWLPPVQPLSGSAGFETAALPPLLAVMAALMSLLALQALRLRRQAARPARRQLLLHRAVYARRRPWMLQHLSMREVRCRQQVLCCAPCARSGPQHSSPWPLATVVAIRSTTAAARSNRSTLQEDVRCTILQVDDLCKSHSHWRAARCPIAALQSAALDAGCALHPAEGYCRFAGCIDRYSGASVSAADRLTTSTETAAGTARWARGQLLAPEAFGLGCQLAAAGAES